MLQRADTTQQMKLPNRERQFHLKAYQAVTWNKFVSFRIKVDFHSICIISPISFQVIGFLMAENIPNSFLWMRTS